MSARAVVDGPPATSGAWRSVGNAATLGVARSFIRGNVPHALLIAGPANVGKTTLALDLAAALLCTSGVDSRPCRQCRACRLVDDGNHPDVHRIAPDGPGGQIRIDQVRGLVSALALLSVEGGARVAIVEHADRANEDAQNALLKTLEEPPSGVTIVLCADDEDRLLPTIRSRCVRLRLGAVGVREIESLLERSGMAEPPRAGRIARASDGRPGRAITFALAPDAVAARDEIARTFVDLLSARRSRRLAAARELVAAAATGLAALDAAAGSDSTNRGGRGTSAGRGRGRAQSGRDDATTEPIGGSSATKGSSAQITSGEAPAAAPESSSAETSSASQPDAPVRVAASERRRAVAWLLEIWTDVARDLLSTATGDRRRVRDQGLLDDLDANASVDRGAVAAFVERLVETSRRLESNVSPELALDVLVVAWPRTADAA